MSLSRDSLTERQWKLIRRTQFRLDQGLARLKWEEEVLIPEIEAFKSGKAVLSLPEGSAIDIVVEDANPCPAEASPKRKHARR